MLHSSNSVALPGALLLSASGLVIYRHATDEDADDKDALKTFLIMIVLQMLPLALLETKMMSCTDPVGLLPRMGTKIFLMHMCFLALRVYNNWEEGMKNYSAVFLIAACVLLLRNFRFRPSATTLREHGDVACVALLSLLAAIVTQWVETEAFQDYNFRSTLPAALAMTADYIEILAFVPALWLLLRSGKQSGQAFEDPRAQAFFLFGWLVAFYLVEDVGNMWDILWDHPLAAAAHFCHFLLLLDFSGYFLAHIYNPDKLKGQLMRWLPEGCLSV